MGLNSEYNDAWDYEYDYDQYEENDNENDVIILSREDLEDLYSTELLNMWYLISDEFPRATYQSFCEFCFDSAPSPVPDQDVDIPEYVYSLWTALREECSEIIQDRTVHDFFVYLYKQ